MRSFSSALLVGTLAWFGALAALPTPAHASKIPALFVIEPVAGECMWRRYTGADQFKDLTQTKGCPHDIWWQVGNPSKVVAIGDDRIWLGSHRSLRWIALPHDDITTLWVVKGKPVVGRVRYGDTPVLESFVLKGDRFVPGPTRTLKESDFYGGDPLARPPEAKLDKAWTSLGRRIAGAASKQGILDEPTPAQRALVSAHTYDDTMGMVKVGGKNLAYKGIIGDTAHPAPPLVWCSDATCSRGTPIQAELPSQLALSPKDGFVLVSEEYTGLSPVVYQEGGTKPVLSLPPKAKAFWF